MSFPKLDQPIGALLCLDEKHFVIATGKETTAKGLVVFIGLYENSASERDFVPFGNKNTSSDFCRLSSWNWKTIVSKVEQRKD